MANLVFRIKSFPHFFMVKTTLFYQQLGLLLLAKKNL